MRFVDTNVLLYSVSTLPEEAQKAAVARALLTSRDLVLSVQVLQAFYVQATRPSRADALTHDEAVAFLRTWRRFPVEAVTPDLFDEALRLKAKCQMSYWDAAIIAAAKQAGCRAVLSEDLNAGQDYDGVVAVNPFAP